ncbi:hypothetical protein H6G59_19370 [Anabaena lutea FACHB-196]|uniref:Uncharacterized protein n=2 Tax=Anabaena TaxID=1163 RepID=A0ABR8FIM9_9NOST|nr:hypothetical protein [Anabaena lutea]MBD2570016.1 hypothetical protein [Anabaena lutea FACHB-196]
MLEQFRSLYPTGCLISEVAQIFKTEFVVRVSIVVDGVTRATGLAMDVQVALAEDKARARALAVVDIPKPVAPTQIAKVVDLSDLIALTDVHMGRLGWTAAYGQNHLMNIYGKRARRLLSQEELEHFLEFLKAQPDVAV